MNEAGELVDRRIANGITEAGDLVGIVQRVIHAADGEEVLLKFFLANIHDITSNGKEARLENKIEIYSATCPLLRSSTYRSVANVN